MPRYFFNTRDGSRRHEDDTGLELPDDHSARDHAIQGLSDLAREIIPQSGDLAGEIKMWVVDDMSRAVVTLTMSFEAEPQTSH